MNQSKRLLTRNDMAQLHQYWGKLLKGALKDQLGEKNDFENYEKAIDQISEVCSMMPGTLSSILDGEYAGKIGAEKLVSLFYALNVDFRHFIPADFFPSGGRGIDEVMAEIIKQYGATDIEAMRKALQEYFSVDREWVNENLLDVLSKNGKFVINGGKIELNESEQE